MKKTKYFVLGLISMAVVGLTGCGGTKVDMTDYVTVEFTGINGDGTAACQIDAVKLEQDLAGDEDGQISQEELEKLAWITQFEMTLSCELDQETGLSNGDKVTVMVRYDEDFAKENKVKVTGEKKEFKVEGLKDPIEVDAFASGIFQSDTGVLLEYSGTAPDVSLTIRNQCTREPESLITYSADRTSGLKNGDEIRITAELSAQAAEEGYVLKETEKTVTVEGLDSYVSSLSQLKEADKAEVLENAEKFFRAKAEDNIYFYTVDDAKIDMNTRSTTFSDFAFSEDTYETADKKSLILPFTVNTTGSYYWIGREFYNDSISKTFTGVNGYLAVQGLKVDSEGNLTDDDNVYYEIEGMYEDKAKMESVINADDGV